MYSCLFGKGFAKRLARENYVGFLFALIFNVSVDYGSYINGTKVVLQLLETT
jgi:hypothetical protein